MGAETYRVIRTNFYPRPPRGGRHQSKGRTHLDARISIHALREEGDLRVSQRLQKAKISIHALREEGDMLRYCASCPVGKFLSTPSARRATAKLHKKERF